MTFEDGDRAARELLRHVDAPVPFDVMEFCRRVAAFRERPIELVPMARDEQISGVYVDIGDVDRIGYSQATSPYHQQVIILHEVGHLVMDHYGLEDVDMIPSELLADISMENLKRVRSRHRYTNDEERAAEGFATSIIDSADRLRQATLGSASETAEAERHRLASMFVL